MKESKRPRVRTEGKPDGLRFAMDRYQMPIMHVNIMCHKHEPRLIVMIRMKMGKEDLNKEGQRWMRRERGYRKE